MKLERWARSGKSIVCRTWERGKPSELEIPLNGSAVVQRGQVPVADPSVSPSGALRVTTAGGVFIEEISTGRKTKVLDVKDAQFQGWSPDGRLFTYAVKRKLPDDKNIRVENVESIWVGAPEENRMNHMCLVHETDIGDGRVIWSPDGLRIAYVERGRLHLAELTVRELTDAEKAGAGLGIDEQQLGTMILSQAKQIGTAIHMYAQDWDGQLPSADTAAQDLTPYLRNSDIFNLPGTTTSIFTFTGSGDLNSIADPAATVIGYLDAGNGIIGDIYADGHVRLRPRTP
jgi:hypothetical protein